jgi:AraC family transcriptional regulator, exoenzyme S synthesis regulatory protein ExsA
MLRVPSAIKSENFALLHIQDMTFVAYRSDVYPEKNEVFFEENAVIVVLEGEKKFSSPTQDIHVKKGDVLFFQKGCYFMNESLDTEYRSLVFFFPQKLLKEFVHQHLSVFQDSPSAVPPPIICLSSHAALDRFIASLLPYFEEKGSYLNEILRLKFQELLLHLLSMDTAQHLRALLFRLYKGEKRDLHFLMEEYTNKPLHVTELAQLSGRSLSVFKREFETAFGTTPAAWLQKRRLAHATFLLRNQHLNVSEVSQQIGYESVSHFIKIFQKTYGCSPKHWQRIHGRATKTEGPSTE